MLFRSVSHSSMGTGKSASIHLHSFYEVVSVVETSVVGVDLDYETVGESGSMLMVTASGTAVRIED